MLASIDLRRLACAAVLLVLAACEHAEGGVCQNDSDCEDGLVCDPNAGDEDRSVCRHPGDVDSGTDAGTQSDADGPLIPDAADANVDSGGDSDAGGDPDAG